MTLMPPDPSSTEGNPLPEQNPPFDVVDALVGRNLGHFRVGERLGSGAMAAVYRARDLILERDVALKVLLPGADDVVRARFRQEARTVSVLDHPHIVHTLQVGQTDGITYIAMELIEGTNLSDLLGEHGRLSVADSCRLLEPVARALAYAHRHQVVHRDVKPSNILLRRVPASTPGSILLEALDYGVIPLLSDFGISLGLDSPELTAAGRTVGTPTYMAPEQAADSHEIDGRADIYALGVVLYRCLVGRPPFVGTTTQILHAHVYEQLTIPAEIIESLPPVMVELLKRMLAKEPDDRYPNASLLADDLALAGGSLPAAPTNGQATATMPSLPSLATSERVQVLIPAPGTRTTPTRRALPPTALQPADEKAPPRGNIAPARAQRRRQPRLPLIGAALAALILVGAGLWILRSALPLERLLVQMIATPVPGTPPGVPPVEQTPIPDAAVVEAAATPTLLPAVDAAQTPQATAAMAATQVATATQIPLPAPTISVDVELYWEVVVDDYNQRKWNKILGNLILILRSESDAFNQAYQPQAQEGQSQAGLVKTILLENVQEPLWAQWRAFFDPAQIERMFFDIYVGLATEENATGEPQLALEHFAEALILKPDQATIATLHSATDQFLTADEAERDERRRALGLAHQQYGEQLVTAQDYCGAYEQFLAVANLLPNENLSAHLDDYRQECNTQLEAIAGEQLRKELSGVIIYSTQEGNRYAIYQQPLAADEPATLLVENARLPRLSPDGTHLAFYDLAAGSPGQGISGLMLVEGANPAERTLRYTTSPADGVLSPPSWSPDGDRFVFASDREVTNRHQIYIKSATTVDDPRRLATGQDPAWRPSSENWIAYNGRVANDEQLGLWMINDAITSWYLLSNNPNDRRPAWAPDGQQLVFMSNGRDGNWEVYRLALGPDHRVTGSARLTNNSAQDGLPTVSPDGEYVAYVSDEGGYWRIWVAPLDGSAKGLPVAEIRGSLTSWLEHSIQWVAN